LIVRGREPGRLPPDGMQSRGDEPASSCSSVAAILDDGDRGLFILKSRDAFELFKAREQEQEEAKRQPKMRPSPDDDPDERQDDENQRDEDRPVRVLYCELHPPPMPGASSPWGLPP
jgi:hypothetical protein